jgi:hypothetical protein
LIPAQRIISVIHAPKLCRVCKFVTFEVLILLNKITVLTPALSTTTAFQFKKKCRTSFEQVSNDKISAAAAAAAAAATNL